MITATITSSHTLTSLSVCWLCVVVRQATGDAAVTQARIDAENQSKLSKVWGLLCPAHFCAPHTPIPHSTSCHPTPTSSSSSPTQARAALDAERLIAQVCELMFDLLLAPISGGVSPSPPPKKKNLPGRGLCFVLSPKPSAGVLVPLLLLG